LFTETNNKETIDGKPYRSPRSTRTPALDEINNIHAGMLGIEGSHMHFQPMAPNADPKSSTIWFFTKADTDLVRAIRAGSRAHFCVVGKNHDYHACLSGTLEIRNDRAKIDEYWSAVTSAWYERGKEDPLLTLLAFRVDDAEIWASTDSTLKFGWEIAKANLKDEKMPDVGVKQHLAFRSSTEPEQGRGGNYSPCGTSIVGFFGRLRIDTRIVGSLA
jgi:general stress protein 26